MLPSFVDTYTSTPNFLNSSSKNKSSFEPNPSITVGFFPAAIKSLHNLYIGGVPTPPPITAPATLLPNILPVEVFVSLTNIISCYLGLEDKKNARKYWKTFKKRLDQKNGDVIIKGVLNNSSVNLLTNFEYYSMNKELDELIEMLEFYEVRGNHVIDKLVEYYKINNNNERIAFIEKYLLPTLVGKVHFTYCKWMLDMCIIYFRENRKYKKATLFETEYLKQFKEYYFK